MSTPGFAENTLVSRLVGCRLSVVVFGCCGPPKAFPLGALVYRGCLCRVPPVCHRVQGDSEAKRQPLLCVVVGVLGVVTSCVLCARVPRGPKDVITNICCSCATENTYKITVKPFTVDLATDRLRTSTRSLSPLLISLHRHDGFCVPFLIDLFRLYHLRWFVEHFIPCHLPCVLWPLRLGEPSILSLRQCSLRRNRSRLCQKFIR